MQKNLHELAAIYFDEKIQIASNVDVNKIIDLYKSVLKAYENDSYVFILGNGGSASIAEGLP